MARQVIIEDNNKSRDMVSSSSGGFCYSDNNATTAMQTHLANQIQGFVSDPAEMFNLTAGMEMIGFHKNLQNFIAKHGGQGQSQQHLNPSQDHHHFTSGISEATSSENHHLLVGAGAHDSVSAQWQLDESSLRCVFPCEGNERPSQGLSLSLSSNNPSTIGLQSFELRQQQQSMLQQQQQQDGYLSANKGTLYHHGHNFVLKNSKYLVPAQELLNEFCSLDTKHSDYNLSKQKSQKNMNMQWGEDQEDNSNSSTSKKHSLTSLEFAELQKRKTKLLSMLEEVDRRYRHYRNQMKAVVSSFEAVAGNGAATVYSALALKAMSRHFRCLKDGILSQIHVTRKTMGEKDPVAPGTTKGETPRLKIIDQTLRQQRAFQQMNMMETHPWRPQRGLPERSVSVLRAWLFEHFLHPYPSDVDKHILARQTGLSRSQVSNWFINARVRLWKPMVEEMYLEETKEGENENNNNNNNNNIIGASSDWTSTDHQDHIGNSQDQDQKPTPERLVRFDSESASSIINNNNHNQDHSSSSKSDPKNSSNNKSLLHHHHHMNPQSVTDNSFGSVELDFSSYTQHHHHSSGMVSFNGGGSSTSGGVSLTLGLQQHGVSLAFPPPSHHQSSSLLYSTRDHHQIEDCQSVHEYSLLDGDQGQNHLPYRNLMGAQLLHDLAG